jgi:hypothetical protein
MSESGTTTEEILQHYRDGLEIVKNTELPTIHRAATAMYLAGVSFVLGKVGVEHEPIPQMQEKVMPNNVGHNGPNRPGQNGIPWRVGARGDLSPEN